jgi:hypothetical protein
MTRFLKGFLFFVFLLEIAGCSKKPSEKINLAKIQIVGADSMEVGQKNIFKINFEKIEVGEKINLVLQNSWGLKAYDFEIKNPNSIKIAIMDTLAGLLTMNISYKGKICAEKSINIKPKLAALPLDAYLGSKSIVANGKDWAMITAIPTDKFGNLLAENTKVDFNFLSPTNKRDQKISKVKDGVAFQKVYAETTSGKTFIGASIDSVVSKEKELLLVADFPENFKIKVEKNSLYADARQTFQVKTSIITDKFGNILPEGSNVVFQVNDANKTSRLFNAYTIDGVAEVHLQNPVSAGNLQVKATVYGGGQSNLLDIPFQSAFENIPIEFDNKTSKLSLKIGLMRGKLNQLLPNGLIIELRVDGKSPISTEVVNGYAIFDLSDFEKGKHNLQLKIADNIINKELIINK